MAGSACKPKVDSGHVYSEMNDRVPFTACIGAQLQLLVWEQCCAGQHKDRC